MVDLQMRGRVNMMGTWITESAVFLTGNVAKPPQGVREIWYDCPPSLQHSLNH
jgi:hypothetical protein